MRHAERLAAAVLAALLSLALVLPVAATEPPTTTGVPTTCDLKVSLVDGPQTDMAVSLRAHEPFIVWGFGYPANTSIRLNFHRAATEPPTDPMTNVTFDVLSDAEGEFAETLFFIPQTHPVDWELAGYTAPPDPAGCFDVVPLTVHPPYPFFDIDLHPTGHFVLREVTWLYQSGITTGCHVNLFCPDGLVTRQEMASFLVRALALPATSTNVFSDDETSIHEADINRLAASGITTGCTATRFCPTQPVTRQEMASFLVRGLGLPLTSTDFFTDDETSVHEGDINRLAASGITTGCNFNGVPNTFCPGAPVIRAHMAAFLFRALFTPIPCSPDPSGFICGPDQS